MIELTGINTAKQYSDGIIEKFRSSLMAEMDSHSLCIVTVGSFARREASEQSDLDFFIITDGSVDGQNELEQFREMVSKLGIKPPAKSGTFNGVVSMNDVISNIGGAGDDTENLTRRLLVLLEGEWL